MFDYPFQILNFHKQEKHNDMPIQGHLTYFCTHGCLSELFHCKFWILNTIRCLKSFKYQNIELEVDLVRINDTIVQNTVNFHRDIIYIQS